MSLRVKIKCGLCERVSEYGPPDYRGKQLPKYDLFVCKNCYDQNSEGILRNHEGRFEAHLAAKNIPLPARNDKGLYPRD